MDQGNDSFSITIPRTLLLLLTYIAICFGLPVTINMILQRTMDVGASVWVNTLVQIATNLLFFLTLAKLAQYRISFMSHITATNFMLAVFTSLLLYCLLDHFFDPIFSKAFPTSEVQYQEMLQTMKLTPVAAFMQACLLAPITEEILMRGYILHGLSKKHGVLIGILLSTLLFAILHINISQILSAFIGGLLIALLYMKTKSMSCCILAHILYNSISFFSTVL